MARDLNERDALVLGMTRPPMLMGVTHSYFVIEGMAVISLFLLSNQLPYLLAVLPTHVVGVSLCRWDTRCFDILFRVARYAAPVRNRSLHRCNRYVPL